MPTNLLGTGQALDSSTPTVFADFLTVYDEMAICKSCMDYKQLTLHTGPNWNRNNYGRVTAASVPDGTDITQAQALSDATTTISGSEIAVQVILPGSTVRRSADADLVGNTGEIMGNAYALFEDTQLLTGLASYTTTALGANTQLLSPGFMAAMGAGLRIGNNLTNPEPWPKPWFCIAHPMSGVVLEGRMIPLSGATASGGTIYGIDGGAHSGSATGSMTLGNDPEGRRILKEGVGAVMTIAGLTLKYDANLPVDTNTAVTSASFGKSSYLYINEVAAHQANQSDDASMRGAIEMNIWGAWGQGIYRPAAGGIPFIVDCSRATS